MALLGPVLAACSSGGSGVPTVKRAAFTSSEYGVKVSPRLSKAKHPPKGGGRNLVGKPYTVKGKTYVPEANPQGYVATGSASWYGDDFHGRQTANGEIFSANAISGAHPTLPLPSYVRVTNIDNGRSVMVRVNDRGPYVHGRVMDLSYRAAEILGYANRGVGNIQVEYVGPAPLNGDDTKMLMASVNMPTRLEQGNTRLAMQQSRPDALAGIINMFGYAETGTAINGAHAAAEAMATRAGDLGAWVATVDDDQRAIKLQLGTFKDPAEADAVVQSFALLGAVDEEEVRLPGADATRLTLTHLKPGVARDDVMAMVKALGLTNVVLN